MTTSDHRSALAALLPRTAILDDGSAADAASLADVANRLNEHLPELFMAALKEHVAGERADFIGLFADPGKGALAWNDTQFCIDADGAHGRLVVDLDEIVRSATTSTVANVAAVRVSASPAEVVRYLRPRWLRVKAILTACLADRPDVAALITTSG